MYNLWLWVNYTEPCIVPLINNELYFKMNISTILNIASDSVFSVPVHFLINSCLSFVIWTVLFRFYGLSPFNYSATYYFPYFLASETNVSEDDIIRIHDDHGNTIELLESGGQYLSASSVRSGRYPNPVTNIPRLRKMNVNEDDIFLCAYPKAGMM